MISLLNKGMLDDVRLADLPDITQFAWKLLLKAVADSPDLKRLDLSSNSLGKFGTATGSPLRSLVGMRLDSLNLANNKISSSHVQHMLEDLWREKTSINSVKLNPGNKVTDKDIADIKSAMSAS